METKTQVSNVKLLEVFVSLLFGLKEGTTSYVLCFLNSANYYPNERSKFWRTRLDCEDVCQGVV